MSKDETLNYRIAKHQILPKKDVKHINKKMKRFLKVHFVVSLQWLSPLHWNTKHQQQANKSWAIFYKLFCFK